MSTFSMRCPVVLIAVCLACCNALQQQMWAAFDDLKPKTPEKHTKVSDGKSKNQHATKEKKQAKSSHKKDSNSHHKKKPARGADPAESAGEIEEDPLAILRRAMMHSPTDSDHLKFGNDDSNGDNIQITLKNESRQCSYSKAQDAYSFEYYADDEIGDFARTVVDASESHCTLAAENKTAQSKLTKRLTIDNSGNNGRMACYPKDAFYGHDDEDGNWVAAAREELEVIEGVLSDPMPVTNKDSRPITYRTSIPALCHPDAEGSRAPCPLLVGLHGAKGDIMQYEALKYQECADDLGAILLLPAIDWSADTDKFCKWEDIEYVRPLVQQALEEHASMIDTNRVILYGQSTGATASMWGAMRNPDLFTHVFAVSPKSFWRPSMDSENLCQTKGIEPWLDYGSFLEHTGPIFKERAADIKLQQVMVFIGVDDLANDTDGGDVDFGMIPRMFNDLDFEGNGITTELRIYPALGHACWVAAFNELYDTLWRGVPSPPEGLPLIIWKYIIFILVVAFLRLAYLWPLFPPSLLAALKGPAGGAAAGAAVSSAVASKGIRAIDVKVELSEGSVVCKATVQLTAGTSAGSVQSSLQGQQKALLDHVVRNVTAVPGIEKILTGKIDADEVSKPTIEAGQVSLTIKVKNVSYKDLLKDKSMQDKFTACIQTSIAEHSNGESKAPPAETVVDFKECLARVTPVDSVLGFLKPDSQKMALGSVDGKESLSHAQLHKMVSATDLARFGISSQTKVATLMPGGDMSAALLLVLMARYAVAPLSAALRSEELRTALARFEVKAVITTADIADAVIDLLPKGMVLIVINPSEKTAGTFELNLRGSAAEQPLSARTPSSRLNGPEDVVLLLATSGTTSAPKVVPATLHRLMLGATLWAAAFNMSEKDVGLNVMPLYHIGGIITNVCSLMVSGASLVCAPSLSNTETMKWLKRFGITYFSSVPTVHAQLLQIFKDASPSDRNGVVLKNLATGAAHCPDALAVALPETTGAALISTYGMSECMPMAIAPMRDDKKEAVGIPVCGELTLITEGGKHSLKGESGEVCVRGPLVMQDYLSGGKRSLHDGGWFRTGDLGKFDDDGWLYLIGRSKEVINRGGELISPFEVDSAASQISGVKQALSFAVPHAELGEAVGLALVTDANLDYDEIRAFLTERLSAVKTPELVVIMSQIPKGPTGKPKRIELAGILGTKLSASTNKAGRFLKASTDAQEKNWTLTPICEDAEEDEVAVDSLGFVRKFQNEDESQLHHVQQALYGLCAIKLMWQHWLPPDLYDFVPEPVALRMVLEGIIHCRTLLVMIFPLLGYFDGAAVLQGESPMKRAPLVAGIYCFMSWPYFYAAPMMSWAEGYGTFHRWPIFTWLLCLVALTAFTSAGIPPWFQVLLPLGLAPLFGGTVDSLHGALGLQESPANGALDDPTFIVLEHSFWWSVGAKFYFAACYLFAFHFMAPRAKLVAQATKQSAPIRVLAFVAFILLTALWQTMSVPYDPMMVHEELSDWPTFLGMFYPLQIATDWACIILLVVAVGKGFYLIRLLGESILGTMIAHMYFALPFGMMLGVAFNYGGPVAVVFTFFAVPVCWTLSFGAGFQYCALKVVDVLTTLSGAISGKAE